MIAQKSRKKFLANRPPMGVVKVQRKRYPNAKDDLDFAAYHEAGHVVVAQHYGIDTFAELHRFGKATMADKAWGGSTYHSRIHSRTWFSPYRQSVVGWAGVIAECFWFGERPNAESVFEEHSLFDYADLSDTDRECILRHPNPWRTCVRAARLIEQNMDKVSLVAQELVRHKVYPFRRD